MYIQQNPNMINVSETCDSMIAYSDIDIVSIIYFISIIVIIIISKTNIFEHAQWVSPLPAGR